MSVRVVRTRNGEDVICDLYEVTTKNEPNTPVAFQLSDPYNVWLEGLDEPRLLAENEAGEEMQKISDPEIHFRPWVPLSSTKKILLKTTNQLGRKVKHTNQFIFYIYDDGSVEKKYIVK